jgi:hypothetical protein
MHMIRVQCTIMCGYVWSTMVDPAFATLAYEPCGNQRALTRSKDNAAFRVTDRSGTPHPEALRGGGVQRMAGLRGFCEGARPLLDQKHGYHDRNDH